MHNHDRYIIPISAGRWAPIVVEETIQHSLSKHPFEVAVKSGDSAIDHTISLRFYIGSEIEDDNGFNMYIVIGKLLIVTIEGCEEYPHTYNLPKENIRIFAVVLVEKEIRLFENGHKITSIPLDGGTCNIERSKLAMYQAVDSLGFTAEDTASVLYRDINGEENYIDNHRCSRNS